ncbi:hypothetical protein [Nonomuraea sp. NPDC048916]|uniref:hypothetical protein n=1 Tax=Nonomuraea sp. NPDC048916 TaxID=3154232 RepID=UPI0033D0C912
MGENEMRDDASERLSDALTKVVADLSERIRSKHEFSIIRAPDSGYLYVGLKDGRYWSGGSMLYESTDFDAIGSVAECLQDCVMEVLWIVWPECPSHGFGLHVRQRSGEAVWSCEGAASHVVAAVGALNSKKAG